MPTNSKRLLRRLSESIRARGIIIKYPRDTVPLMWGGWGPRGNLPVTCACVGITKLTTVESLHNSHTGTKENGRFKEVAAGRVSGGSFVEGEK